MNKEPLFLYICRFILAFVFVGVLCMLYWSSELLEQDVKNLQTEMDEMKSTLQKEEEELSKNQMVPVSSSPSTKTSGVRSQMDPLLPNLLEEDPFYDKTLPKLLGPGFHPQFIGQQDSLGRPKNLHPFSNWAEVANWIGLCSVNVASQKFGIYETLSPDMALKMEARMPPGAKVPEFWIFLRDHVYWQPLSADLFSENIHLAPHFMEKLPVTAHDFKFFLDAIMNPFVQEGGAVAMRNYLRDIKEIEVIDDLTFVVRWKPHPIKQPDGSEVWKIKYSAKQITGGLRPLALYLYAYYPDGTKVVDNDQDPKTYRNNSVWAQQFSDHWARNIIPSCGAWTFKGMTERQIDFARNSDFYFPDAALMQGIHITFRDNADAIWQDFEAGNLDSYTLRPEQLIEWEKFSKSPAYAKQVVEKNSIKRLDYLTRAYIYIGWNSTTPYFNSKKMRQALTMAINRKEIIQNILNGMGEELTGPFFIKDESYDPSITPWPYDPTTARRILAEEGWYDSQNTGIIDKMIDGKRIPFRFRLTYYVKNPTTQAVCAYIASSLKEIGIDCQLYGVDLPDLSRDVFDDKNFDAYVLAWSLGTPPDDPRQLWHSSGAKEKGSSNPIGFANPEVDRLIDTLEFEDNKQERIRLYHKLHAIFHEEEPYTFLYIPKTTLLYREYLQNVFIPADRQDLIPGANVEEPQPGIFWLKKQG